MSPLLKLFHRMASKLTDSRVAGRVKHKLANVVTVVFLARCCGHDTWYGISKWSETNYASIKAILPDFEKLPSEDSRIIRGVDPKELNGIMASMTDDFIARQSERGPGRPAKAALPAAVAIDGKTLCGAEADGEKDVKYHILNAVCSAVTMAALRVDGKTNEIKVVAEMLELLAKRSMLKDGHHRRHGLPDNRADRRAGRRLPAEAQEETTRNSTTR
jgi:hypothetical protein